MLIIGSDSYIARHFITSYHKQLKISGISRISTGYPDEVIYHDFDSIDAETFTGHDTVLNCAAIVHHPHIQDFDLYEKVNHKLAVNNAIKAKEAGIKLFIQMSTISVYGNQSFIDIHTQENPIDPYGFSKLHADKKLLELQDNYFKVAIIRPPMVYGGGYAPGNMLRLIKLIDKGIPLLYRKTKTKRDYIHIRNLIQYLYIICTNELNGIFLICDGERMATEDIFSTIVKYLGKKNFRFTIPRSLISVLKHIRPVEFEKLFGTLEIQSNFPLENLIKKHSFDSGIHEMVNWYLENKKNRGLYP